MKDIDFNQTHELSNDNREKLSQANVCGCFYCLRIFDPKEIVWEPTEDDTAMCPYCGIDSVIAGSKGLPITKELLQKMRQFWFTESE
jgi:hypothetical protein